jgi:predicted transcriptional regulator
MPKRVTIGRAELEVLQYLHDHHPATVREVADHIGQTKGVVRTTVLNVMARLLHKGYLLRRREQGVWRYSPREEKSKLLRTLVRDFVDKALGGSVGPFVMYLAEDSRLTREQVDELRQIVQTLDASPQSEGK